MVLTGALMMFMNPPAQPLRVVCPRGGVGSGAVAGRTIPESGRATARAASRRHVLKSGALGEGKGIAGRAGCQTAQVGIRLGRG